MPCSACNKNRNKLTPRKSRLMPSMTLFLCNSCLEKKIEPRFVVVLCGRANGLESIKDYIKNQRYVGLPITAIEIA